MCVSFVLIRSKFHTYQKQKMCVSSMLSISIVVVQQYAPATTNSVEVTNFSIKGFQSMFSSLMLRALIPTCTMQYILNFNHVVFDISLVQFAQGDQNSPGIIPLAIKDVFSIIQDVSIL